MVTVRTDGGVGSGVVFRADVVVTNEHVVGAGKQVIVEYADGGRSGGAVVATDSVTDLAVVRTERKDLPVAEFRRELPRPGDPVLAIGSPPARPCPSGRTRPLALDVVECQSF